MDAMRSPQRTACFFLAMCLPAFSCGRRGEAPLPSSQAPAVVSTQEIAAYGPVQIEMKNVRLHMDEGVALDISRLRGEMTAVKAGQAPVFDDPASYVLHVSTAEMTIAMPSLTSLLNDHVFAGEGAPLSDITVKVEDGRLEQKGKLHKGGVSLPFSMAATVSASPDGRLRLHAESAHLLGIPSKKLMDIFGLDLDDVVTIKDRRGVEIDGDDVLIEPGRVLPPPRIVGRLARVDLANGRLNLTMSSGGKGDVPIAPADSGAKHYVYFAGNEIRFGKLLMTKTDLQLIDADERDPFDFFPAKYRTQLVAGYSKNTPAGGLRTYMPDFNDVRPTTDLRPGQPGR